MIRGLFLLRNVVILTLILSCVFSFNVLYGAENINDYIMEEITDNTAHPFYTIPIKFVKYIDFDFKITKHIILVTLAGILSVCSMKYLAHKLKRPLNRPTYLQSILEGLIDYMNKDVIGATLGEEGKKYVPFCLTVFLFVLFSNILGLIPASIKFPTEDGNHSYLAGGLGANIGFTAAIAVVVFIVYIFAGIRKNGNYNTYQQKFCAMSKEDFLNDLIEQIYINADIAFIKLGL